MCTYMHVRTCMYMYVCTYVCTYIRRRVPVARDRVCSRVAERTDRRASIRYVTLEFSCGISAPKFSSRISALASARSPPPPRPPPAPPRRAQPRRDAELTSYLRKFLRANSCAELARIKSALLPSPLRPRRRDSEISGLRHVVDLDDTSKAREFQRRGRERHWLQYGTVITHCLSS